MAKPKSLVSFWTRAVQRNVNTLTRATLRAGKKAAVRAVKVVAEQRKPPAAVGDWLPGVAFAPSGMRRYHLYRPPGVGPLERVPLLVMLHGCGQNGRGLALASRMNRVAARERFVVLYPEQELGANAQGCWNWFETRSGKAQAEAASILAAIDQVCLLYPVDPLRVAIAGLSAGASMAALMAQRYPHRFRAVAMHSGVAPGSAASSAGALKAMRGHKAPAAGTPGAPPLLVIHGDGDLMVSARNGAAAARIWAEALGALPGEPRSVRRGQRYPMRVTDYRRSRRTVAMLCEISGLGHAWSGGEARQPFSDPRGPDASRLIWSFAARQFRTARAA